MFLIFKGNLLEEYLACGIQFHEIKPTNGIPRIHLGQPLTIDKKYIYFINTNSEYGMDVYKLDMCTKKWQLVYDRRDLCLRYKLKKYKISYYNGRLFMFSAKDSVKYLNSSLAAFEVSYTLIIF